MLRDETSVNLMEGELGNYSQIYTARRHQDPIGRITDYLNRKYGEGFVRRGNPIRSAVVGYSREGDDYRAVSLNVVLEDGFESEPIPVHNLYRSYIEKQDDGNGD